MTLWSLHTHSIGKRNGRTETGIHPPFAVLTPTLTWIMSYVKSCHSAVPIVSAVGLSFQGAQTADNGIIPH